MLTRSQHYFVKDILVDPNLESASTVESSTPGTRSPCDPYLTSSALRIHSCSCTCLEWEDESPYPEVRAAVSNTDDMDMPVNTIRAFTIGLAWAIIIPGLNQFLFFRYPSITVGSLVAQLLSFPIGQIWARAAPNVSIFGQPLNPGPFTVKEHVVITVMATVGSASAYATGIFAVQRHYYGQNWSFAYQWLLTMSTQLIGFSLGGVLKRFLVSPPSMIWPANLVACALLNTLHSQVYSGYGHKWGMSRERFFFFGFTAALFYYILPGYLFTALSTFSWVSRPAHMLYAKLSQLFGYSSGLGMSILTFDWNNIAFIGSPLATPWWAEANVTVGFLAFFWLLAPILYYANAWWATYLPMMSRSAFDNTGALYNVSMILNENGTLDIAKYKAYSPIFISMAFAISYGMNFATITATLVHAFLYFRKQVLVQATRSLHEQPDVHARLMSRYPQVPEWWYICIFVIMFGVGAVTIEVWPTQMPIWGLVTSLLIAFLYIIPTGMLQAITNQQIGLNVLTEFVGGYALPGKPIALMIFKTYGYIYPRTNVLWLQQDMKLGHYMKIPPRTLFWCQVCATVIAGTVQLGVQAWMFSNVPDLCHNDQPDHFNCAQFEVFYVASVIWGAIGPQRVFSSGQIYHALLYFFLIGAITPIIGWLVLKRWPGSIARYVSIPIIFAGTTWIPPATAVNYIPWAVVGFLFNYVIRKRHFSWWAKYNYVLSAALDCGTAVATLLVFFCLDYPLRGTIGQGTVKAWWGNTVYSRTADARALPLNTLAVGETFGPAKGTW
ncbi:OPT oligopeptide transporter [Vararia minispora EC-137]|uniref:OPT oligopeptide transporter n=1 Tax=Vararia minispora EC-137 TaxID=1314806 RepID=A0ACB8QR54_9AGAM|nr:OPT oligopeptide transporter [Vararia minispora EC-137]